MGIVISILRETWTMTALMGPYLLIGFALAGLMLAIVEADQVRRWMGRRGFAGILRASLVGVPMPLCSCGVIPVAAGLRKQGAGKGATVAFLASTPETGLDSIAATWGIMGPAMALIRAVTALITGITAGCLVDLFAADREPTLAEAAKKESTGRMEPLSTRLKKGLCFAFFTLPRDLVVSLSVGLLLAGAVSALIPTASLTGGWTSGLAGYLTVAVVAIPIYVCSTGSIPLAYSLVHAGFSPGAALVFLIAGPATNIATISTMGQLLGRKAMLLYLLAIVGCSFSAAGLVDTFWPQLLSMDHQQTHVHGATGQIDWIGGCSGALLLGLLVRGALERMKDWFDERGQTRLSSPMPAVNSSLEIVVSDMECANCARSIKGGLGSLPGVTAVQTDLASGKVAIQGQDLNGETIRETIRRLGFTIG